MSASPAMITPGNVDLSNCDREQIQYAGAILPHGVLITASEPAFTILQISVNCLDHWGTPAEDLIGKSLSALLDEHQLAQVSRRLSRDSLPAPSHILKTSVGGKQFDLSLHRCDGVLIFEFELREMDEQQELGLYSELRSAVGHLESAATLQAFFDLAAEQIREFTGFDRVLIYKFMPDGSGWVRSESLNERFAATPYLGLHYPPSDIPEPARRLFRLTWVRHQPDIGYTPVPITPAANPTTGNPLDMSCALLRSVSVMYSQYLKNMGTTSSMVMTLLKDGKLWGLIACHHHSGPKHVPYEVRMACEFTAHMVSLLMSAKEDLEHAGYQLKLKSMASALIEGLSKENDFAAALLRRTPNIADFVHATGAALVLNGQIETVGPTPTKQQINLLLKWLSINMDGHLFETDSIVKLLPEARGFGHRASGLLALRFAKTKEDFVLWFRPELAQTVNWAGNPNKPVDTLDGGQRLTPRTSFAVWKETVHLRSAPWLAVELQAASELRSAILELVLRKAEDMGRFYGDLERSHAQLDAFSYVAAHDLKEPLRGIGNYTEMLREDYGSLLDDEGRARLATLSRLTHRMDDLLDSLLEYSRVGRGDFADGLVNMNEALADALDTLSSRIEERWTEIRIPKPLPPVKGDRTRLYEVFLNLISNALKYNDKVRRWVEIGVEISASGCPVFYVRDNGIGIQPEHIDQIFQIFRRLHGRDEYGGGSGAGLTIAQKIVERHSGRLWVDSVPGQGSTFRFTVRQ